MHQNLPARVPGTDTLEITATSGAGSTPTSDSQSPVQISVPAAVGIAIGCIVAGALLGLAAAFILFRRRKKATIPSDSHSAYHEPKPVAGNLSPAHSADIHLSHFLLEAVPDEHVLREVQSLNELIRQHVESHYHFKYTITSPRALSQSLENLGFFVGQSSSSMGANDIAALCLDPKTRCLGLRRVLLHVIFNSINFHARAWPSMLPAPMVRFLRDMPSDKGYNMVDSRGMHFPGENWEG